jgi:hypothetical protein
VIDRLVRPPTCDRRCDRVVLFVLSAFDRWSRVESNLTFKSSSDLVTPTISSLLHFSLQVTHSLLLAKTPATCWDLRLSWACPLAPLRSTLATMTVTGPRKIMECLRQIL